MKQTKDLFLLSFLFFQNNFSTRFRKKRFQFVDFENFKTNWKQNETKKISQSISNSNLYKRKNFIIKWLNMWKNNTPVIYWPEKNIWFLPPFPLSRHVKVGKKCIFENFDVRIRSGFFFSLSILFHFHTFSNRSTKKCKHIMKSVSIMESSKRLFSRDNKFEIQN